MTESDKNLERVEEALLECQENLNIPGDEFSYYVSVIGMYSFWESISRKSPWSFYVVPEAMSAWFKRKEKEMADITELHMKELISEISAVVQASPVENYVCHWTLATMSTALILAGEDTTPEEAVVANLVRRACQLKKAMDKADEVQNKKEKENE